MVVKRTDIVMRPVMYVVQFKPQSHLNVYLNLAVTSHENTEQMTQRVCHYAEYWSVKLVADSGSDSLSVTVWKSWFRQLCVYGVLTGENHVFKHTPLLPGGNSDTCSCGEKQQQQNVCKILTRALFCLWCARLVYCCE